MGVFVEEEVVSSGVFGNPAGQIPGFRRVGVDQLDGLLLHVQPLKHGDNARITGCFSFSSKHQQFSTEARRLTGTPQAHQLYVVDAFLGKLLHGSLGCFLQWESDSLEGLVLTLHADIGFHLQGAANTQADKHVPVD